MSLYAVTQSKRMLWRFVVLLALAAVVVVLVFIRLAMQSVDNRRSADLIYQFNQQASIINHIGVLSQYYSLRPSNNHGDAQKAKKRDLARAAARNELRDLARQLLVLTDSLASMQELMPLPVVERYFEGESAPSSLIEQYAGSAQKVSQLSIDSPALLAEHLQRINDLRAKLNSAIEQTVNVYYQYLLDEVAKPPHNHWLVIIMTFFIFALLVNKQVLMPTQRQVVKAEEDAAVANRIKNEFLTSVSHEIRTPMHGIIGAGENLAGTQLNARQSEYIRTIISSAESLLDVINDILGYSSLESGDIHVEALAFNMYELTADLVQIMNERASLKDLKIVLRYDSDSPHNIVSDSSLVRQVLYHLLSNAIKFTEVGHIVVTVDEAQVEHGESMMKISVEDTGIGIPEDKQQLIFEQFVQGEGGTKRLFSGTGLGLTIVKKLVELMDGTVKMGSVFGEGSTFSVYLPLRIAVKPVIDSAGAALSTVAKIIWLSDEDDDSYKNQVLGELGMAGLQVLCYSTEAISGAAETINSRVCVVAIDERIPTTEVAKLIQQLSRLEHFARCRYVTVTRSPDSTSVHTFRERGIDDIFCLPADTERLVSFIAQAVPTRNLSAHEASYTIPIHSHRLSDDQLAYAKVKVQAQHGHNSAYANPAINYIENASILLVEDNRINATLAQDMLHDFGAQVTVAENGCVAVNKVRSGEVFDLILMDCMMPEMDGFEATRAIRALPQTLGKQLPIIALTANAMAGDKERCLDSGMDAYLSKPVRKKELRNTLNRWLNYRQPSKPLPLTAMPSDPCEPKAQFDLDDDEPWQISTPKAVTSSDPASLPAANHAKDAGQPKRRGEEATADKVPPELSCGQLLYLDSAAVAKAKAMMKRRFATMIEYFLEDTQNYIEQIYQGIDNADYNAIVVPAHTIKSSSRQMGATAVSELSKELETLARAEDASFETFRELADQLQEQFDLSRIDFNYLLSEAS